MDDLWNEPARFDSGKGVPRKCGKNFVEVWWNKEMKLNKRGTSIAIAGLAVLVMLAICGGCKTQKKNGEPQSSIFVESQADGIHLKTAQSEFLLTSNGSLLAHLRNGTQWLTLDEARANSGLLVTSDKQLVHDFVRDLANPQIKPEKGKLGALGKRVDVKGHSASSGLDELLTVER